MATYLEIRGLYNDDDLQNKIEVAMSVAGSEVLLGNDDSAPYDQSSMSLI